MPKQSRRPLRGGAKPARAKPPQKANKAENTAQPVIDFWEPGFSDAFYAELERRYLKWRPGGHALDGELDCGTLGLLKQICILETTIQRDTAQGRQTEKSVNALNALIGSANLKPVQQKKEADSDAALENTPLGVLIKKWEDTRPIPEPAPQFRDVDGIMKYISVWFLGHACKMLKVKNSYSEMYEAEIEKYRVEKPEYEED